MGGRKLQQKQWEETRYFKPIILFIMLHHEVSAGVSKCQDWMCMCASSCVSLCVWLCSRGYLSVWQEKGKKRDEWWKKRLSLVGVGWHNEWHIVKSLPTKQSLPPCKWDSLDKDLFDGTHAEYEAVNSLISIPQSWLAKTRESQPESMSAKLNIDLFNGVRESKFTNLLSIVYEAV